jgi:hypothetical protein
VPKHQRRALGIEHDRCLEKLPVGRHVVRRRMPEMHLKGLPGRPAQAEHDVAADRHRRVAHGNRALGVRMKDVVAQHGHAGTQFQPGRGAAIVHIHVTDERVEAVRTSGAFCIR